MPSRPDAADTEIPLSVVHENVRGGDYYDRKETDHHDRRRDDPEAARSEAHHHGPGLPRPAVRAARQPAIFHREDRGHGRSRVDRPRQPPTRAPAARRAPHNQGGVSRERVVRTAARSRQVGDARPRDVPVGTEEAQRDRRRQDRRREDVSRRGARPGRVPQRPPRPLHARAAPRCTSSRSRAPTAPTQRCSPASPSSMSSCSTIF